MILIQWLNKRKSKMWNDLMNVKIFTEAGNNIGYGHLFRCLSLYDELRDRGIDPLLIIYGTPLSQDIIKGRRIEYIDWINTSDIQKIILNTDYIIVDSYLASQSRFEEMAEKAYRVLYIDDENRLAYSKGIVVNPSLSGKYLDYSSIPNQKILTGLEYIILRKSFIEQKSKAVTYNKQDKKIFIMLGGTDSRNLTKELIDKFCIPNKSYSYEVVVPEQRKSYYQNQYSDSNLNFHSNLSAAGIAKLMINSDFAITGAGQTIFELIYLEIPFIAIQLVNNQIYNVKGIKEYLSEEMVININQKNLIDCLTKKINKMLTNKYMESTIKLMTNLIDGLGTKRIIDQFLYEEVRIRPVEESDIESIFELSNQPYVRKYSINKEKITWNNHVKWFNNTVNNKNIEFYIVNNEYNDLLGQVRFNMDDNDFFIVSISIAEVIKGKGLSKEILRKSIDLFFSRRSKNNQIIAYISKENIPSMRLFKGLGFEIINKEDSLVKLRLKKEAFYVNR